MPLGASPFFSGFLAQDRPALPRVSKQGFWASRMSRTRQATREIFSGTGDSIKRASPGHHHEGSLGFIKKLYKKEIDNKVVTDGGSKRGLRSFLKGNPLKRRNTLSQSSRYPPRRRLRRIRNHRKKVGYRYPPRRRLRSARAACRTRWRRYPPRRRFERFRMYECLPSLRCWP